MVSVEMSLKVEKIPLRKKQEGFCVLFALIDRGNCFKRKGKIQITLTPFCLQSSWNYEYVNSPHL